MKTRFEALGVSVIVLIIVSATYVTVHRRYHPSDPGASAATEAASSSASASEIHRRFADLGKRTQEVLKRNDIAVAREQARGFLPKSVTETPTPRTKQLNEAWRQPGGKPKLLQWANDRLTINCDDMPGLLIQREYAETYADWDLLLSSEERIVSIIDDIHTPEFLKIKRQVITQIDAVNHSSSLQRLDPLSESDKEKAEKTKDLICYKMLEACERDGLFDNDIPTCNSRNVDNSLGNTVSKTPKGEQSLSEEKY